jgi:hypothetical protein
MHNEPTRIISASVAARRLAISQPALAKHIRRGLIRPDYESDSGIFFEPQRLPELRETIATNRVRKWRHISVAAA